MTDETVATPPEGWYPDPEDARYLRWWNGYQWELRKPVPKPGAAVPGGRRPLGRRFALLERTLGVLLLFVVMVLLGQVVLYLWGVTSVADAVARGDVDTATTFDDLEISLLWLRRVCVVSAGVCWMAWQHEVAASAQPGELRRDPGMHAFSWVIPIANLWLPVQNVRDLWSLNVPLRGRALVNWWWTGWIVSLVAALAARGASEEADSVDGIREYLEDAAFAAVVTLVTAVLAILIVRRLTNGARARDAELRPREAA